MGNCFSCQKKISLFGFKRNMKEVMRDGYQPPENMTDYDDLCKSCCNKISDTQTRGRTYNKPVNMKEQMILTVFAPGWSALRIEKWTRFVGISFLLDIAIIGGAFVIGSMTEIYEFYGVAIIFYFISPFDFYFLHKWTKEWNKEAI